MIDSGNEGKTRGGGEVRGGRSDCVDSDEEGCWNQDPSEAETIGERVQSVDKALEPAHRIGGQGDEKRGGSSDVACGDYDSADQDRPGNCFARVLDLVAHCAARFDSAEGKEDA